MASLWKLSGIKGKVLAKGVWSEIQKDDVFGRAAQLSYYFLLALFPLLIFLTSIIGMLIGSAAGLRSSLFSYLAEVMPPSAFQLIESTMWKSATSTGGKLSLVVAARAASNGMGAITEALNVAYGVRDSAGGNIDGAGNRSTMLCLYLSFQRVACALRRKER